MAYTGLLEITVEKADNIIDQVKNINNNIKLFF